METCEALRVWLVEEHILIVYEELYDVKPLEQDGKHHGVYSVLINNKVGVLHVISVEDLEGVQVVIDNGFKDLVLPPSQLLSQVGNKA